jgi:hypothetical protein
MSRIPQNSRRARGEKQTGGVHHFRTFAKKISSPSTNMTTLLGLLVNPRPYILNPKP